MLMIVLVIFVCPIVLSVPGPGVCIPPTVTVAPAIFTGFGEVVSGAVGLWAAITVVLDSLMESVVSFVDAFLAIIVISTQGGGCA
jgi:phage-related minor tail protein